MADTVADKDNGDDDEESENCSSYRKCTVSFCFAATLYTEQKSIKLTYITRGNTFICFVISDSLSYFCG